MMDRRQDPDAMNVSTIRKLPRLAIRAAAAGAFLLGALAYAWWAWTSSETQRAKFEAVDITSVDWGKGFELTDFNQKQRTLADFRGKLVLLFFGFTSCPDVCPTTMAKLGEVMRLLGADADRVQGLFVTVDPKRDTPQLLAQYVPAFHPTFLGLYGTEQQTASAAKEFKVYFQAQQPDPSGFYTVDHSSPVFAFDRRGRLRLLIRPEINAESVARDLRALLKETAG
jgi:protein SCO1/2